jgi:hypothetical protein
MWKTIKYYLGRHSIGIIAILLALLLISAVGNIIWLHDNAELLTMGLIKLGVWLSAFLLITKFGFPKFNIQEKIKDEPLALAILITGIAIAIALSL